MQDFIRDHSLDQQPQKGREETQRKGKVEGVGRGEGREDGLGVRVKRREGGEGGGTGGGGRTGRREKLEL